jgi:hypothetical protein
MWIPKGPELRLDQQENEFALDSGNSRVSTNSHSKIGFAPRAPRMKRAQRISPFGFPSHRFPSEAVASLRLPDAKTSFDPFATQPPSTVMTGTPFPVAVQVDTSSDTAGVVLEVDVGQFHCPVRSARSPPSPPDNLGFSC